MRWIPRDPAAADQLQKLTLCTVLYVYIPRPEHGGKRLPADRTSMFVRETAPREHAPIAADEFPGPSDEHAFLNDLVHPLIHSGNPCDPVKHALADLLGLQAAA